MTDAKQSLHGQCHCGGVQFEVTLADGFNSIRRCNCSYCTMRGAVAVSSKIGAIHFTQGQEKLTLYQFNTRSAKHYFCSICGIYTHHQRRSNPSQYGVNVACLDGVSPYDFDNIPVLDGQNHPQDNAGKSTVVGHLHFIKEQK